MTSGALLTTLPHVKAWLNIDQSNTTDDTFLTYLIKSASAFALNYMQRDSMAATVYNEMYDGYGNTFMVLRQFPAHEVLSLSINGNPISAAGGDGISTPFSNGYVLEQAHSAPSQQRLTLFGLMFPRIRSSVYVSYKAGYMQSNEQHTVPVDPQYTVCTYNTWLEDEGVTLSDGTPLVLATTAEPGPGQYWVSSEGEYSFNAAQAGELILISYSFVPPDVEQAVWELVGERYKAKDRIGVNSKALGGQETVSFDIRSMNPYIRELLNPYKRVVPV